MKNLTTLNTTSGSTNYFTKSFDSKTKNGLNVTITVSRRVIKVTNDPYKTKNDYSINYKGEVIEGHAITTKKELNYFLDFTDKYYS